MQTFAEETLVLLLDHQRGTFLPIDRHTLDHTLVGAVLMDLAFANRIDTDATHLMVIDPTPTGNPMLDAVLERIAASEQHLSAVGWLKALSGDAAASIRERALASLEERGVVERREKKILRVFRTRRYPLIGGEKAQEAKRRIARVLFSDSVPDPHDIALICLADACGALSAIFEEAEIERNMDRIQQLRKMDLIGREMLGRIAIWKFGLTGAAD